MFPQFDFFHNLWRNNTQLQRVAAVAELQRVAAVAECYFFHNLDSLYNGISYVVVLVLQNPELKILFQSDIRLLRY